MAILTVTAGNDGAARHLCPPPTPGKNGSHAMDEIDKRLIAMLQQNAREPVAALAKRLGISRSTTRDRLDRLQARGVIVGYTLRLGPDYAHKRILAHAMLNVDPKRHEGVAAALAGCAGVRALYAVSGEFDLIAVLEADTPADMDALLDAIGDVDGVIRTRSSVLLSEKFSR